MTDTANARLDLTVTLPNSDTLTNWLGTFELGLVGEVDYSAQHTDVKTRVVTADIVAGLRKIADEIEARQLVPDGATSPKPNRDLDRQRANRSNA